MKKRAPHQNLAFSHGVLIRFVVIALMSAAVMSMPVYAADNQLSEYVGANGYVEKWIVRDGFVANHILNAEKKVGEVVYISTEGKLIFSYPFSGEEVLNVSASQEDIYILFRKPTDTRKGKYYVGKYSVIRCSYAGKCAVEKIFAQGVFDIEAHAKGFFAVTYDFDAYRSVETMTFPIISQILDISGLNERVVCCYPSGAPSALSYTINEGLFAMLDVVREDSWFSEGVYKITSDLSYERIPNYTPLKPRGKYDYPLFCQEFMISGNIFFCVDRYYDAQYRQINYKIYKIGRKQEFLGSYTSVAKPVVDSNGSVIILSPEFEFVKLE